MSSVIRSASMHTVLRIDFIILIITEMPRMGHITTVLFTNNNSVCFTDPGTGELVSSLCIKQPLAHLILAGLLSYFCLSSTADHSAGLSDPTEH